MKSAAACAAMPLAKATAPGEFVIVQGVVDLAILRSESISILDFKTDTLRRGELEASKRDGARTAYRDEDAPGLCPGELD